MTPEFKGIRLQALQTVADDAAGVRKHEPPSLGWLRAVREGLGLSLRAVAAKLGVTAQALQQIERNEVRGAVTLKNLDRVASTLGCRVVYVLVPQGEGQSFADLAAATSRDTRIVADAEHSMNLEAQGVGQIEERARKGIRRGRS